METIKNFRYQDLLFKRITHIEIRLQCPFCKKQNRRFDDYKLYYHTFRGGHCFRCGWKGHLPGIKQLISSGKAPIVSNPLSFILEPRLQSIEESLLPQGLIPAWQDKVARLYLKGRGLTEQIADQFALYFCEYGYFENRVIVPITDQAGEYSTFVARSVHADASEKYLFPKGCHTSKLLYNFSEIPRGDIVWLVEGVFDALHTYPYGVASFGTHISDAQIQLLRKRSITHVVLLWDNDCWRKSENLWNIALRKLSRFFTLTEVKLPKIDSDPTDYTMQGLHELVRESLVMEKI